MAAFDCRYGCGWTRGCDSYRLIDCCLVFRSLMKDQWRVITSYLRYGGNSPSYDSSSLICVFKVVLAA